MKPTNIDQDLEYDTAVAAWEHMERRDKLMFRIAFGLIILLAIIGYWVEL